MRRITIASTLKSILGIIGFIAIVFFILTESQGYNIVFSFIVPLFLGGVILFVGSVYYTGLYLKIEKELFSIESLPLLTTDQATEGVPICVQGRINADNHHVLTAPYSGKSCVYYHSITEEYIKQGESKHWKIVEHEVGYNPFYIQDHRGKLDVDITNIDDDFSGYQLATFNVHVPNPDKSEIDATKVLYHQRFSKSEKLLRFIPVSKKFRRSEFILTPNTEVFVYGYPTRKNNRLVVHEEHKHPLIISKKPKNQYVDEFYKGKNLIYLVHFLAAIGFTCIMFSISVVVPVYQSLFIFTLVIGNLLILGSVLFTMYNRAIILKKRAETALSNIDIELKRRADLIPKIVDIIKHYQKFEKKTQDMILKMRVEMAFYDHITYDEKHGTEKLLAVLEDYPKLKSEKNFNKLMKSLTNAEERIAYTRALYNRNVRKLNTLISQFPFIVVAVLLNIQQMEYVTFETKQANS